MNPMSMEDRRALVEVALSEHGLRRTSRRVDPEGWPGLQQVGTLTRPWGEVDVSDLGLYASSNLLDRTLDSWAMFAIFDGYSWEQIRHDYPERPRALTGISKALVNVRGALIDVYPYTGRSRGVVVRSRAHWAPVCPGPFEHLRREGSRETPERPRILRETLPERNFSGAPEWDNCPICGRNDCNPMRHGG